MNKMAFDFDWNRIEPLLGPELQGVFSPYPQKIGEGGMGIVIRAKPNKNHPNYRFLQSTIIACHQSKTTEQLQTERKKVDTLARMLEQAQQKERELADSGDYRKLSRFKGEVKKRKEKHREALSTLVRNQFDYIEKNKKGWVNQYSPKEMEVFIPKKGIVLPDEYALKFALSQDPELTSRLIREWNGLVAERHPNIVDYLFGGEQVAAMEFIPGRIPPRRIVKEKSVEQKLEALVQVLSGLERAHELGIVHRDLKPDNILITEDGTVKIVDFGLAQTDIGQSMTGKVVGTPHYMSPEQWEDSTLCDERTDIYAVGAILYYFLTEQPPFHGSKDDGPIQILHRVSNTELQFPRRVYVDPDMQEIVRILMAKDPDQRPQTAGEAQELLEIYLEAYKNEPTMSEKSLLGYQPTVLQPRKLKFRTRGRKQKNKGLNRGAKVGTAVTVGALAVLIGGYAIFGGREPIKPPKPPTVSVDFSPIEGLYDSLKIDYNDQRADKFVSVIEGELKKKLDKKDRDKLQDYLDDIPKLKKAHILSQYNVVKTKANDLEAEIQGILARGTDLKKVSEAEEKWQKLYPDVIRFQGDVPEAQELSQRLLPLPGKLAARKTSINGFNDYKTEVQNLQSELDTYWQKGDFEAVKLVAFSQRIARAKTEAGEYRGKGFPDLTSRLEGWEGKIVAQQEVLRKKAEQANEPKLPEAYLTLAGEYINFSKGVAEFIESKSLDAAKSSDLMKKLAEYKKQGQEFSDLGIQGADKLLEKIVEDEGKLTPNATFISKHGETIKYVLETLPQQIEETNDKGKLNTLKSTVRRRIFTTAQLKRRETAGSYPLIDELVAKLKAHQQTIEDKIAGVAAAPKVTEGCVLYLPMDAGNIVNKADGPYVQDLSKKGLEGKIVGAKLVKGIKGEALEFDGNKGYVSFSTINQNIITVATYISSNKKGDSDYPRIISMPGYELLLLRGTGDDEDRIQFDAFYSTKQGSWASPLNSIGDGKWYHIVVVYDGSSPKNKPLIYINGVSQTIQERRTPSGTKNSNVGIGYIGNRLTQDRSFDGLIDEVVIFDRALRAEEIKKIQ
ncbi:protein kinase [Candidatus Woesearchaeota archaeon]|nr:protein kinase [Candidatus Woesearchaeota archaeon]